MKLIDCIDAYEKSILDIKQVTISLESEIAQKKVKILPNNYTL